MRRNSVVSTLDCSTAVLGSIPSPSKRSSTRENIIVNVCLIKDKINKRVPGTEPNFKNSRKDVAFLQPLNQLQLPPAISLKAGTDIMATSLPEQVPFYSSSGMGGGRRGRVELISATAKKPCSALLLPVLCVQYVQYSEVRINNICK
jgi:hypothetical protein